MSHGKAIQIALRYLQRRARTEKELRQKLADKHVMREDIDIVIKKLKGYGYIDDIKFTADYQRARDDYRPTGLYRLRQELKVKGVAKEIIITLQSTPEKEFELALAAANTRLRQYHGLNPEVFRRRMSGFLARRGFGYDIIKRIMADLMKGKEHD